MPWTKTAPVTVSIGDTIELVADGYGANMEFIGARATVVSTRGDGIAELIDLITGPIERYGVRHKLSVAYNYWTYKKINLDWDD